MGQFITVSTRNFENWAIKGQLILKGLFDVIVWAKKTTKFL